MMSGLFEQSKARSRGTGALPGPAPFASFRYNCERHDFFSYFFLYRPAEILTRNFPSGTSAAGDCCSFELQTPPQLRPAK